MNLKFKAFTLLLILISFACKEDKKETPIETATEKTTQKQPNKLVFEIDLTTTQPDDFKLYANNIFLNNNQFMNLSITQSLNNNETSKTMRFEFPEGVVPDYNLIFSLGNSVEKEVIIRGISLSFGSIKYNITPSEIDKYFRFNKFIEYNSETNKFKTKKIDGKHNPTLTLKKKYLINFQNEY